MKTFILSLGGSVVVPTMPDSDYIVRLKNLLADYISSHSDTRFVLVVGGGATARNYQNAAKKSGCSSSDKLDWIGIRATHINAEFVSAVFGSLNPVVVNPVADDIQFDGNFLVAGGWKPGFSTDMDSMYLAERFSAQTVINLSNIDRVYTSNPKTDSSAVPIDDILWSDFIKKIVGDKWIPGANLPFDPVASAYAKEHNIDVICADGRDTDNLLRILDGRLYTGTHIHN